jgi:hypothetical protein
MLVCLESGGQVDEYSVLEFQGELVGLQAGQSLGELRFEGDSALMSIGDHLLRGSSQTLNKPLMLTEKTKDGMKILGFIKRRIIFNMRPEYAIHK